MAKSGATSRSGNRSTGKPPNRSTGRPTSRSVSKARGRGGGGSSRTPTIAAVAVVVILAVVVIGGILWTNSNKPAPGTAPIPIQPAAASYPTKLEGNVIVAGTGPTTIDLYEDVQCSACKQFESLYGEKVARALHDNKITARYHMVNLLDQDSNPPGYSSRGGGALMCATANSPDGSAFATLHNTLYVDQPPENGSGLTDQQLVDAGQGSGASGGYASCVQGATHSAGVAANFAQAQADPALQQPGGGFATPTIVLSGKTVQPDDPALLAALG